MGTAESESNQLIREIEAYLAGGPAPRYRPPAPPRPPRRRRSFRPPFRPPRVRDLRRRPWVPGAVVMVVLAAALTYLHPAAGADHASGAPAGPGYSFLRVNRGGTPTRWNPCQPIHFEENLSEAPASAGIDLAAAIDRVETATGLRFVDDGPTTVIPKTSYGTDPARRPKPVIIAWARSGQTDKLGASRPLPGSGIITTEIGRGGPVTMIQALTGHGVNVSGSVVIDADASAAMPPGFGPGSVGIVLMHELGHLVGLGHVDDPAEIMNPSVVPTKDGNWGPGDLAGLARLGRRSGCLAVPHGTSVVL